MLKFFEGLATRLTPWRSALGILTAIAAGVFIATFFVRVDAEDNPYQLLSIAGFLWTACLVLVSHIFAVAAPRGDEVQGWWRRLKWRALLAWRWLVALVMAVVSVMVLVSGYRAVSIALHAL